MGQRKIVAHGLYIFMKGKKRKEEESSVSCFKKVANGDKGGNLCFYYYK